LAEGAKVRTILVDLERRRVADLLPDRFWSVLPGHFAVTSTLSSPQPKLNGAAAKSKGKSTA
jgi:hypothetical protein